MEDINDEATDRKTLSEGMADLNNYGYEFALRGGYDQRYNRAAKEGMKFELLPILTDIPVMKDGAKIEVLTD